MISVCGRCRVSDTAPGQAWCDDCVAEDSPNAYIAGMHVSQLDPAEVRSYGCTCPAGGVHNHTCPVLST